MEEIHGNERQRRWHHRPTHVFVPSTAYIVTARTIDKQPIFAGDEKLTLLQDTLFEVALDYGWLLEAWAVFRNHYHFIATSPREGQGRDVKALTNRLHSQSSRKVNRLDSAAGRHVWFQYRDTCLTYEKSYLARLNYVNMNAVKHKLVTCASKYPYCSAAWFEAESDPAYRRKVESFRYDHLDIEDDF